MKTFQHLPTNFAPSFFSQSVIDDYEKTKRIQITLEDTPFHFSWVSFWAKNAFAHAIKQFTQFPLFVIHFELFTIASRSQRERERENAHVNDLRDTFYSATKTTASYRRIVYLNPLAVHILIEWIIRCWKKKSTIPTQNGIIINEQNKHKTNIFVCVFILFWDCATIST